jgi:hypothetical protein
MRTICNGTEAKEERKLTGKEKKKRCKTSRLGCLFFNEQICSDCLDKGYDMHTGKQANNVL